MAFFILIIFPALDNVAGKQPPLMANKCLTQKSTLYFLEALNVHQTLEGYRL
jgi:hypothetical protein